MTIKLKANFSFGSTEKVMKGPIQGAGRKASWGRKEVSTVKCLWGNGETEALPTTSGNYSGEIVHLFRKVSLLGCNKKTIPFPAKHWRERKACMYQCVEEVVHSVTWYKTAYTKYHSAGDGRNVSWCTHYKMIEA